MESAQTVAVYPIIPFPTGSARSRLRRGVGLGTTPRTRDHDHSNVAQAFVPAETRSYPVLRWHDFVAFPHMMVRLFVGRKKSTRPIEEMMRSDTFVMLATQRNASDDDPATDAGQRGDPLDRVLRSLRSPDDTIKARRGALAVPRRSSTARLATL